MDEWLLLQSGMMLYGILFFFLLGGAIGLPIPEDIPLILAGVMAQTGKVRVEWALPICYLGIVIGDVFIFSVGRKLGPTLFQKRWFRQRFSIERIRDVRFRLEKRSLLMIFIARHLFYLRTVTFLACGAVRMSFARFLFADAVAALISAPLMIFIGYSAAENYQIIFQAIKELKIITLLLAVLAIISYFSYQKFIRVKAPVAIKSPAHNNMPDLKDDASLQSKPDRRSAHR